MIKRFSNVILAGLVACAPAAATGVQAAAVTQANTPADTAQLIARIDRRMTDAAAKDFGGSVVIEQGSKVLLSKGYGFADRERRVRFTPDTIAQIGSIAKSQTAAAIAILIAQGKVSLSDPVSRFVPEASEPGRSRTIAQLLSHSAGLMDSCTDDFDQQSETMLVHTCLTKPLAYAPGADHYSNLGYSLLALLIQRATGKSWEAALREQVWEPMGIRDIGYGFRGRSDDLFAHGYLHNMKQPVISRSIAKLNGNDWALRGNGGIQASSKAMMRFLDHILDPNGGLPSAARALLLAPVPGQSGDAQEGFGLYFHFKNGKIYRMGHSGSDGTFFSYLAWVPANDVRFYFVGNNGDAEVKPVLKAVLDDVMALPPPIAHR
jgi:CubicO group peptidase (beta-lactamase class C family)